MSPYRKSWERTGAGGTCSSGHHGAGSQCPRRGVCRYEPKLKCNGEVRWTGTPLTCQFCTKLQSGGRKMQQGRRSPAKWSQQPCWDTPYRKWSERRGGHSATGSREDSGLLSRECGGGRIHASPRMPCSAMVSALDVMMGTPFTPSATSRKALSLSEDSKTKSTRGRRPSWSRSAHPLWKYRW